MKTIKPYFVIEDFDGAKILKNIEKAARVCYKSESSENSAENFVKKIINSGHESVIEHEKITVLLICDRGVTHELVRHRIASYSQESTRYCNYSHDKFGGELTFIEPSFWEKESVSYKIWQKSCEQSEENYLKLLEEGATPQEARAILPNSLKTEIYVTMNLREWRHFFKLRTAPAAHPQMREITIPLLDELRKRLPVIFDNL
ncbi:thymidylate synthase [Clostridia bacterium]|nr:thymidylate synthase [Clostridia bacterium]